MQIRTKLTVQFTVIVTLILILFSCTIYYFSANLRKDEFYTRLRNKAITTAKLLSKDVHPIVLKTIDHNSKNNFFRKNVAVYNLNNEQLYKYDQSDSIIVTAEFLDRIKLEKEVRYSENEKDVIGILFESNSNKFIVVVAAYDMAGYENLNFLKFVLSIGVIVNIVIIIIAGLFFSKQALQPISNVVNQVDTITAYNLNSRVNVGNGKDEIAQLSMKFNKMLERLEASFELQRSFVANASHELRTPLTSLTGQIEVSLMNNKVDAETKQLLQSLLDDIKNLNKLSNGLLDLAQANLDISEIKLAKLRIDELIVHTRAELIARNKDFKINVDFKEFPENEEGLSLNANEHLIKAAFVNIIENACKYDTLHKANVEISFIKKGINILVSDNGIGIPPKDLELIYEPFFRSENAKSYSGNGIGLTLTKRIINLHRGKISIDSKLNTGTSVAIFLPYG